MANKKTGKKSNDFKQKKQAYKRPDFPTQWYYMATDAITVTDIKEAVDCDAYDVEIWEEAGVLEVGLAEKASMDFEACELDLRDEYSNAFLEEKGTKALFFVTIPGTLDFKESEQVMKKIIENKGGLFCADSQDFMPMVTA